MGQITRPIAAVCLGATTVSELPPLKVLNSFHLFITVIGLGCSPSGTKPNFLS